jgi:hypothetical protein
VNKYGLFLFGKRGVTVRDPADMPAFLACPLKHESFTESWACCIVPQQKTSEPIALR